MYADSIRLEIKNYSDGDVVVFSVPRLFDSDAMQQKLMTGLARSHARHSTFRAVINYDYVIRHMSSIGYLLEELNFLTELPKHGPEYRIAIVTKSDMTLLDSLSNGMGDDIKDFGDFMGRLVRGAALVLDVINMGDMLAKQPLFYNTWIKPHDSVEDAIRWCLSASPWP